MTRTKLLLVIGIVAAFVGEASVSSANLIGNMAPALVIQTVRGENFELSKLRGKVVVVNFWATWCPPCRAEMPMLDAVYQRYRKQGVAIIGLSADRRHDRDTATKVAGDYSYPIAILSDAQTNGFGPPSSLPLTFVVDRAGIVRYEFDESGGALTGAKLTAALTGLLAEQPAKQP